MAIPRAPSLPGRRCECTRIAYTAVAPKSGLFAAQCEIDRYRRRLEISLAESGRVGECTPIDLAPDKLHAQGVDVEWEGIERNFRSFDGLDCQPHRRRTALIGGRHRFDEVVDH